MAFLRVNVRGERLVETVCSVCGIRLAAAPHERLLRIVERLHRCTPLTPRLSSLKVARKG